jgi:hypothetical protein
MSNNRNLTQEAIDKVEAQRLKESVTQNPDGSGVHTMTMGEQSFSVNLTPEILKGIILEAVRVAKEPDEATKAKLAQDKADRETFMKNMLKFAAEEEQSKKDAQERCSHKKQDGTTRVHVGQIYSDGKIRPMCIWCQKIFPAYEAPRELLGGTGF